MAQRNNGSVVISISAEEGSGTAAVELAIQSEYNETRVAAVMLPKE
jgi:hypothetical protein